MQGGVRVLAVSTSTADPLDPLLGSTPDSQAGPRSPSPPSEAPVPDAVKRVSSKTAALSKRVPPGQPASFLSLPTDVLLHVLDLLGPHCRSYTKFFVCKAFSKIAIMHMERNLVFTTQQSLARYSLHITRHPEVPLRATSLAVGDVYSDCVIASVTMLLPHLPNLRRLELSGPGDPYDGLGEQLAACNPDLRSMELNMISSAGLSRTLQELLSAHDCLPNLQALVLTQALMQNEDNFALNDSWSGVIRASLVSLQLWDIAFGTGGDLSRLLGAFPSLVALSLDGITCLSGTFELQEALEPIIRGLRVFTLGRGLGGPVSSNLLTADILKEMSSLRVLCVSARALAAGSLPHLPASCRALLIRDHDDGGSAFRQYNAEPSAILLSDILLLLVAHEALWYMSWVRRLVDRDYNNLIGVKALRSVAPFNDAFFDAELSADIGFLRLWWPQDWINKDDHEFVEPDH